MGYTNMERLAEFGQSVWLDNINRAIIESGRLREIIGMGLRGMTSNPSIFEKAVAGSNAYDKKIAGMYAEKKSVLQIYDDLTVKDIQDAADEFMPVYRETSFLDGYISLEINPHLAMKEKETIEEGKRLYKKVNRPNLMVKVPATDAGFSAGTELLACGINVNFTLIFSPRQYVRTAEAFLDGIRKLSERGGNPAGTVSVASVFVSRIDTAVDRELGDENSRLKGLAACTNAAIIYKRYRDIFSGDTAREIEEKKIFPQRVLWASTSTKNPLYSDIKYVTELEAKDTVNTMPDKTLDAFLDHGYVREALTGDTEKAVDVHRRLRDAGIDIDEIYTRLLEEGLASFIKSFDNLLFSIKKKAEIGV